MTHFIKLDERAWAEVESCDHRRTVQLETNGGSKQHNKHSVYLLPEKQINIMNRSVG